MSQPPPRERFLAALRTAVAGGALSKLTLGKYRGADTTLRNVYVRPVELKAGPHLCFVWRHTDRDITKNLPPEEGIGEIGRLLGGSFLDAHLFTPAQSVQFETAPNGRPRVRFKTADSAPPSASTAHDRAKNRLIDPSSGWLRDLGVTDEQGRPRSGAAAKLRQIQKFAEILQQLVRASFGPDPVDALRVADMGSGKGYLTFAMADLLGDRASITGVERRPDLVATCNQVAAAHGITSHLTFQAGDITAQPPGQLDVLIALHACNTATDDALFAGINAGARLLIVAPCCHQEVRPQLAPAPVLAPALRHGIFAERQAEFVTDALRTLLLEAQGFETQAFEFISTEHTAKNLMLIARLDPSSNASTRAAAIARARELAALYGVKTQALARHLGIDLVG